MFYAVLPSVVEANGTPLDLDTLATVNPHVEDLLPPLVPPLPSDDIDPRAMVFDPNRREIREG